MSATLFGVSPDQVAVTTDDWYTPRWLFRAAGIVFDMDVCAPVDPSMRTCPAREYLTVAEDGLTSPWHGTIWMNPPYSSPAQWVARFATHPAGLALVPAAKSPWIGALMRAAAAIAFLRVEFGRPGGGLGEMPFMAILASRGELATEALASVALADKYAQGAYHVSAARAAS